jgi:hypothetical protein
MLNSFTKEECFDNLYDSKIIEINDEIYYYSSFNAMYHIDYYNYFSNKIFCWLSSDLDQALLHLFDSFRDPENYDGISLIQPYISRFKLEKVRIINSDNVCNNNIFDGILRSNIIQYIQVILYNACEKSPNEKEVNIFHIQNNRYILYILKLLNDLYLLDDSQKIYGYQNMHDQKEVGLIDFSGILINEHLHISKIVSIENTKDNIIQNFPINKNDYSKIKIVSYMNNKRYTKYIELHRDCNIKIRMMLAYPYYGINYENFDNNRIIDKYNRFIDRKSEEFNDYFTKKYIKYKKKYLEIKNNL